MNGVSGFRTFEVVIHHKKDVMSQRTEYKQAATTRIVGDPHAPESVWLPACDAFRTTSIAASQNQPNAQLNAQLKTLPSMGLVAAISVAAVLAFTGTMAVHLGYDWGYKLVDSLFGQPDGANQGICADFSLMFLIMPLFFGLAFGWTKKAWGGTQRWLSVGSFVMLGTLIGLDIWGNMFEDSLFAATLWIGAGLLFNAFGIWFGERTYSALRLRIRILPLVACAVFASVSMAAAVFVLADSANFLLELALYAGLIALAGGWAARFGKAHTRSAAVLIAATATLPIAIANLLNISANIICLILDSLGIGPSLGWHALLSAAFITLAAVGASTIGGLIGFRSGRTAISSADRITSYV